ncbi:MAG: hypothetical protein ABH837_02140 [bacterium]
MKNRSKKILLIFIVVIITISLFLYWYFNRTNRVENQSGLEIKTLDQSSDITGNQEQEIPDIEILESYDLKVPFISQAPFGVWDELHDEACEEASLLLVHYYYQGIVPTKQKMDQDIKDLVDYQIKVFGSHKDLTSQEVADLARDYFKYKDVQILYDFNWDDLKRKSHKDTRLLSQQLVGFWVTRILQLQGLYTICL